jgi:hypothetical protein
VEFIERVMPVEPLIVEPGAGDLIAMQTLPSAFGGAFGGGAGGGAGGEEARVVIYGIRAGDGALEPLWSRGPDRANLTPGAQASSAVPTVLRLGRDTTDLFWPGARGGWVERVRTATGQTVWRSGEFQELFEQPREGESPAPSGMIYLPTPQDGQVRATDLVFAVDEKRVALVERSGRAAVLDAANGSALWRGSTPVRVVYDAALVKGRLVVAGASSPSEAAEGPMVVSVDAQTGQSPVRVGPAQLAAEGAGAPRRLEWMRPAGANVVVACESSVSAIEPESGRVLWSTPMPDDAPAEGWVAGERVVVMLRGRSVRELSLADGAVTAADVPLRPRLRDAAMIAGHALPGGDLAIVTPSGLSIIGPRGVVKGQDALGAEQTLLAAGWASEARLGPVVALLSTPEPGADFTRLAIVSARDGRLVASHRVRLAADPSMIVAVEGRLIIHAGTGCAVIPLE